jgi:acetyltransferase-like isoleucine patch superfamily enzyme
VSGLRRISRPPWHARYSERRFLRWAARQTECHKLARLGAGSIVYPPALIIGHHLIEIGDDVVVHPGAFFSVVDETEGRRYDGRLVIGNGVRIGFDIVIACCGRIEIGDNVLTADRVYIGDTYHEYRHVPEPIVSQGLHDPRPVKIGDGAFLGINCAILPGVTIGEGACIGANTVVTEDVPPRTLVVGSPARVVRRWDGSGWVDASHRP